MTAKTSREQEQSSFLPPGSVKPRRIHGSDRGRYYAIGDARQLRALYTFGWTEKRRRCFRVFTPVFWSAILEVCWQTVLQRGPDNRIPGLLLGRGYNRDHERGERQ